MHQPDASTSADTHGEGTYNHPIPLKVLVGIFVILLFLTFVTVAITWFDFGRLNLHIAMFIAVIKASLVALYFMHLRYDSLFNGLILVIALVFVGTFISLTMLDAGQYQHEIETYNLKPPPEAQLEVK